MSTRSVSKTLVRAIGPVEYVCTVTDKIVFDG